MNPVKWVLGPILDIGKEYLAGRTKLTKAKLDIDLAEKTNRARLLSDKSSNNHEWEMANLTDKDKWLRRISFFIFSLPFVWAAFDPVSVNDYFNVALSAMPEWYIQLYAAMIGGVWGFSALKNSIPALVGGIKQAIVSKPRTAPLELIPEVRGYQPIKYTQPVKPPPKYPDSDDNFFDEDDT